MRLRREAHFRGPLHGNRADWQQITVLSQTWTISNHLHDSPLVEGIKLVVVEPPAECFQEFQASISCQTSRTEPGALRMILLQPTTSFNICTPPVPHS